MEEDNIKEFRLTEKPNDVDLVKMETIQKDDITENEVKDALRKFIDKVDSIKETKAVKAIKKEKVAVAVSVALLALNTFLAGFGNELKKVEAYEQADSTLLNYDISDLDNNQNYKGVLEDFKEDTITIHKGNGQTDTIGIFEDDKQLIEEGSVITGSSGSSYKVNDLEKKDIIKTEPVDAYKETIGWDIKNITPEDVGLSVASSIAAGLITKKIKDSEELEELEIEDTSNEKNILKFPSGKLK